MKRIDSLMLMAKNRKNAPDPKVVEYLEYYFHSAVCEYNGIENDTEPPEGYNEYMNTPIEPPEPDSPEHQFYQELIQMINGNNTEIDTELTLKDLV